MEIKNSTKDGLTIVEIIGSLDGNTVGEAQEKVLPLITCSMIIDMKDCGYVSSAGLRLLLMIAKQLTSKNCCLALTGVSPEVQDVMEMTGFCNFFKSFSSVNDAVKALRKGA